MDFKTRKRPTLRTLSEATGFAVTTVSRALRNEPEINIQTRKRIQSAAAELGYQPDRAAQGLRMGRSLSIGLILAPSVGVADFERLVIGGVEEVIYGETPHNLVVLPHKQGAGQLDPVRYLVDGARVDGLIFTRATLMDERVRYLLDRNVPFVTFGRSNYPVAHAFVDFDNSAFVRSAVDRLAQKGRKRLAMIAASPALTCSSEMHAAFMETTRELGVEGSIVDGLTLDDDLSRFEEAGARLAASPMPDGIVCGVETGAIALMSGMQRAGLSIGKDVDIVAHSTSDTLDYIVPRIDSYHEDLFAAGESLARFLVKSLDGAPVEELQSTAQPSLVVRT